jgi:TM2 domain-containing membrane protein YozV
MVDEPWNRRWRRRSDDGGSCVPYVWQRTAGQRAVLPRLRTTAGLLQLFLGSFGAGRFYMESAQIAVAQLCVGLFGIFFTVFCIVGLPVLLGSIVWAVVDAIMIFTGSVNDGAGRKLR